MKQRLQGMLMGILVTALLLGTMNVFAATGRRTIEVEFGNVRTTLWGQEFSVSDEDESVIEPFMYDDRAYFPVETILRAMGRNAQWNEETKTLNFGTVEEPTPTPGPKVYLENDIFRVWANVEHNASSAWWNSYPDSGMFTIGGIDFFKGLTLTAWISHVEGRSATATFVYDIADLGFTRLSGVFGFHRLERGGGNEMGTLTITCADSGRLLGGYTIRNRADGRIDAPAVVDVDVTGVQGVRVMLQISCPQRGAYNAGVGFGNAAFQ